jgi:vacuolar-type H+-ATPase subunit I/STV1
LLLEATVVIITIVYITEEQFLSIKKVRGWFVIIYKVPSSPSTARVTVWKKTKELGALPLQQSVYVLPNLPELKDALNQLQEQIQQFGGECKLLEVASLEGAQEEELIEGFNRLRNEEYEEILEECEAFFQEIEKETKGEKFYFSEVEEIEKRLQGLKEWFNIVVRRDFFGVELRDKVSETLKECEDKFDGFSQKVFSREEAITKDSKFSMSTLKLKEAVKEGGRKVRAVYSKDQLLTKLKEIINKLENESLKVGEEPIGNLPESAVLDMKYKVRRGIKSLEIQIEWQDSGEKEQL